MFWSISLNGVDIIKAYESTLTVHLPCYVYSFCHTEVNVTSWSDVIATALYRVIFELHYHRRSKFATL